MGLALGLGLGVTFQQGTGAASAPSPTVSSITDDVGDTSGGVPVTITGTNFTGASGATVGGVAITSFLVVNSTTITGVTGAHVKGVVDVVVQHASGNGTLTNGYEYFNPTSLASCVWWLRADLGITLDGSSLVQTWADQSGIGDANRNASQATAGNRVAYSSSDASYNNKATVGSFNIAPVSKLTTGVWSATYSTFTLGCVGHGPVSASNRYFAYSSSGAYAAIVSNSLEKAGVFSSGATVNLLEAGTSGATPKCVTIAEFNGASSNLFVDSTVTPTTSGTLAADQLGNAVPGTSVGGRSLAGTSDGPEKIAEVFAFNAILSAGDKVKLRKYLNGRYGKSMAA